MNPVLPLGAALASALATWASLIAARRLGFLDRPGGRKAHPTPTPLVGGPPLFLAGWLWPALAGLGLPGETPAPTLCLAGLLAASLLGGLDDRLPGGMGWKPKLAGQLLAAGLCGVGLFPGAPASSLGFVLVAVLLQNAVNFQDNMNGLCAGTALVLCLALSGQEPAWAGRASICLAAALLPLLARNFPRADLFLGDQGSLLLGLSLALLAAAPAPGAALPARPAALLVPALPVIDLLATLGYRLRRGLPLARADRNHLSHRLSRAGLGDRFAVLFLWALAGLLALILPRAAEALAR